mmetsp:Transcript_49325/g.89164  ORF Transcript_49325/g.89164 Transcript_49325/m.89164 type:complete len:743 (-) Transcript_49325:15-2243(-)
MAGYPMQSSLFTPGSLLPVGQLRPVAGSGSFRAPLGAPPARTVGAPAAASTAAMSPTAATLTAAPMRPASAELRPTRVLGSASYAPTTPMSPVAQFRASSTLGTAQIATAMSPAGVLAPSRGVNPVTPVTSLGSAFAKACSPAPSNLATTTAATQLPVPAAQVAPFDPVRNLTRSLGTGQFAPVASRTRKKRPTWAASEPLGIDVSPPDASVVVTEIEVESDRSIPLSPTAIIGIEDEEEDPFAGAEPVPELGVNGSSPQRAVGEEEEGSSMPSTRRKQRIPSHIRMEQERLKARREAEEMQESFGHTMTWPLQASLRHTAPPSYGVRDFVDCSPINEENGYHSDEELVVSDRLLDDARERERKLREEFAAELATHSQTMSLAPQSAGVMAADQRMTMRFLPVEMISNRQGPFSLRASDGSTCEGTYLFVTDQQQIFVGDDVVARISTNCIGDIPRNPRAKSVTRSHIRICESSIEEEIQNPENQGDVFVLNFQFNGVSYSSSESIVEKLEEYKQDTSGELRARLGQLAVHPAAGQFMLDNAANSRSPDGINSLADVLKRLQDQGFAFELVNGYLQVPIVEDEAEQQVALTLFRQEMSKLRTLMMQDVAACGLTPGGGSLKKDAHMVTLVYASAVPVQASLNAGCPDQEEFQMEVAKLLTFAQYYGALKKAADPNRHFPGEKTKVFLMPLGATVSSNAWETIAAGMTEAVDALRNEEIERLDIIALTWSGDPSEKEKLRELL